MQDRAGHAGRAVPVAEAAARLGLRPETLRKQLARGRAPGLRRGGQWFAVLDDVLDVQDGMQDHAGLATDPAPQAPPSLLDSAGPAAEAVRPAGSDVPPVLDSVQDRAGPSAVVAVL